MNRLNSSLVLMMALLFAISGCATYKRTNVEIGGLDTYEASMKTKGITIAADPIDNEVEAREYFYVDVNEANFFPVLMVFQNETNDRIYFLKETVELTTPGGKYYRPVSSEVMADACEHNKLAYALLGFGIFSYMSADEANRKMAADWRDKELPDTIIINPGRTRHGFLYFEIPQGAMPKGTALTFVVESMESKEKFPFEIVLPINTFTPTAPESGTQKIAYHINPQEPWTGVWDVEGHRLIVGQWGMKQNGRIVESTGESLFDLNGEVHGNQLKGSIKDSWDMQLKFVVTIASDGLTFEGKVQGQRTTLYIKGKRKPQ